MSPENGDKVFQLLTSEMAYVRVKLDKIHAALDTKSDKRCVNELRTKQEETQKKLYMIVGGFVLLEVLLGLGVAAATLLL